MLSIMLNATNIYTALAAIFLIYYLTTKIYDVYFGPLSKFPGPALSAATYLPFAYHQFFGISVMHDLALHKKYGPVVRTTPRSLSFLGSAQVFDDLYGHPKSGQLKPDKDSSKDHFDGPTGARSVINADAKNGKYERALQEQEPILKSWAQKLVDKCAEKAKSNEPIDMVKFWNCTTFDVMADLTFGEGLNMLADEDYHPWVKSIFDNLIVAVRLSSLGSLHPSISWLINNVISGTEVAKKRRHEHFSFAVERLNRRLATETNRQDLWTRILSRDNTEDEFTLNEQYENAALFMVAGTETSAATLSGTTYYLLQNPRSFDRLASEIRERFSSFEELGITQLAHCQYLNACIQEGLRMYPPLPVAPPRFTPPGGCVIDGQWIPGGVSVGVAFYVTNHSPERFHQPHDFRPERWLPDKPEEFLNDTPGASEPFNVGPRSCLGRNLAWHEMRLLLAAVVLQFDLELCKGMENWIDQKAFGLWEKKPLVCRLRPVKK